MTTPPLSIPKPGDKVRITDREYSVETRQYVSRENREAIFLGWGVDYMEYDSGPGQYSAAILMLSDGSIEMKYAGDVRFI